MPRRLVILLAVLAAGPLSHLRADEPKPKAPPTPWYIDDEKLLEGFITKLGKLAAEGKCLPAEKLKSLAAADRTCQITPTRPGEKLDPEDVYETALPAVYLVGSVIMEEGEYVEGALATAWVLAADGVLVTNWHVFEALDDGEVFGVMNHKGEVFPVTDLIGVNRAADVAVFRVAAKGLTPLAVAPQPARVGAWVGVLGHPGDRYYTFTQGHVTRYETLKPENGPAERWMAVTAEFAYGSSGSPVLDRTGAVVGMAALTENIDYPEAEPAPKDKEKKDAPPGKSGSLLQMVVKLTTPAAELRKVIGGG